MATVKSNSDPGPQAYRRQLKQLARVQASRDTGVPTNMMKRGKNPVAVKKTATTKNKRGTK